MLCQLVWRSDRGTEITAWGPQIRDFALLVRWKITHQAAASRSRRSAPLFKILSTGCAAEPPHLPFCDAHSKSPLSICGAQNTGLRDGTTLCRSGQQRGFLTAKDFRLGSAGRRAVVDMWQFSGKSPVMNCM